MAHDEGDPLPVVRRARDPGLPHAAEGCRRRRTCRSSSSRTAARGRATSWGFSNIAQFLANRGYAVLQPNFRGSTGYGKKFLNAGNKQWGDKMQDDLTWGVEVPRRAGHRRPEARRDHGRLLRRLRDARRRRLHAGRLRGRRRHRRAVEPHHAARRRSRPTGRPAAKIFHERMGDPDDAGGQEAARAAVAPQLGREDQDAAARRPGRERSAREEGRSRSRSSSRCATAASRSSTSSRPTRATASPARSTTWRCSTAAEAFLAKHLGGRFQEGATPEVVARLKEITVDPKTVVLAKKVDPASVGLPKPVGGPQAGDARYAGGSRPAARRSRCAVTHT